MVDLKRNRFGKVVLFVYTAVRQNNKKEPRISSNTSYLSYMKNKILYEQNDNMMPQNKCCNRIIQSYIAYIAIFKSVAKSYYLKWIGDDVWRWIYVTLIFFQLHMDDQVRLQACSWAHQMKRCRLKSVVTFWCLIRRFLWWNIKHISCWNIMAALY